MKKIKILMAWLAAAALLVPAGAAHAASFTNLGPHYDATQNPCKECHDTAAADPAIRGWAGSTTTTGSGWSAKTISYLCYMCHSSTAVRGSHNVTALAYASTSHSFPLAIVPAEPEGTANTAAAASGLPYVSTGNLECTSCHNVHVATARPFLQRATTQALCNQCHPGRVNNASATSVTFGTLAGQGGSWSTHPTTRTVTDTGGTNIRGTISTTMTYAVPAAGSWTWRVGGHNEAGTQGVAGTGVDCWTCHVVHGRDNAGTTAPAAGHYLAIENNTVPLTSGSALCEGCHFGGLAGEQVGTLVSTAPLYSDHPIDANINRAFYPTGVALPAAWTQAQDFYGTGGLVGSPVCSSCHDMHGGIANTPLLQWPQAAADNTFNYNVWCFACHTQGQVIPNNHHSNVNNMNTDTTFTGGAAATEFTSLLTCGACHASGAATNFTAHNGFWEFAGTDPVAGDSGFCLDCHTVDNPTLMKTFKSVNYNTGLNWPARHGTTHGVGNGSSHQTGVAATGGVATNLDITPNWQNIGGHASAQSEWGAGTPPTPICESCHNILYNGLAGLQGLTQGWKANLLMAPYEDDADDGVETNGGSGVSNHDFYTNTTFAAGQTGVDFCRACHNYQGAGYTNASPTAGDFVHNPPAHTENSYSYPADSKPYGRTTGTVLTDPAATCNDKTTADTATAPGNFTYSAAATTADRINCDSCHRPHNADAASLDAGGGRWLILEATDANWGTTPCLECHDPYTQCQ